MPPERTRRKLAAILSADAVGYSRLMAADEGQTVRALAESRQIISDAVGRFGGRVVDAPGDNVLAEFPSVVDAVQCAVEVQQDLAERNAGLPEERRMPFRIGVNLGDVVVDAERIYGDGVNVAARLEGLADPGGVCISGTVYDQLGSKLALGYDSLGERAVKNIPGPVRVYRVRSEASPPVLPSRGRGPVSITFAVPALAALLLVMAGAWWWTQRSTGLDLPALPTGPTVAVLPFDNLSGDPKQEIFSDGLTEDVITELSRFRDLFVIARNSTFRYKGRPVDVREVRRDLGADFVVEGSVRRSGDELRVGAQLVDTRDGKHLWAETYDRDLSAASVFEIQDEITDRIVGTIASVYGPISRVRFEAARRRAPEDLGAYDCALLALKYHRDNYVASAHAEARDCLERALEREPGYADAWAQLAFIVTDEHRFRYNPRPGSLDRALQAAQRAVQLDPTGQNAHEALAFVHFFRHELDAFLAEADRAIALNPNDGAVLADLGEKLHSMGDERGMELVRRAMALDPYHPTWFNFTIAQHHYHRGEYEEALAAARKINIPGHYWPPIFLAAINGRLGRKAEARAAVAELERVYPGFSIEAYRHEIGMWNVPPEIVELWVRGLRQAGVPEKAEAARAPS